MAAGGHRRTSSLDKAPFAIPYPPRGRAPSLTSRDSSGNSGSSRPIHAGHPLSEMATSFVNSPSPLKRSDALPNLLNLDQAHGTPSSARSRRFRDIRKQPSVDNFTGPGHRDSPFGTPHAAQNPSIHNFNAHQRQSRPPHPLRGSITNVPQRSRSGSASDNTLPHIEKMKLDMNDTNFSTPSALNGVKPLATAFMSTGLLSKRNRPLENLKPSKPTPDTPCKRPTMLGLPVTPDTPGTPLGPKEYFPSMENSKDDTLDDYMFFENEGDSSIIYASSSSDFDGGPHTPTRSLFSVQSERKKKFLFGRSPAEDDNYFLHSMNLPLGDTTSDVSPHRISASTIPRNHDYSSSQVTIKSDAAISILESKFSNVEKIGCGEFSEVFVVDDRKTSTKYAVKRSKSASVTAKERSRRQEEVSVLESIGKHEHIVELFNSWEEASHLFIQTEYCENGSLDIFLQDLGRTQRLDEFRVWKTLTELALGLSFIHDCGYLHLDLKPANIFITFEGVLKIGDFGMSVQYPAPLHIEREGDREYIAPEVLSSGRYDKPVDVFSLGLIILEVAANIVLPENGLSWQKLRSGDLSDAPKLSSSDDKDVPRSVYDQVTPHRYIGQGGLDRVVKWMLSPDPSERPTASEILNIEEVLWANRVRRAGAVIFEGDRGPDAQGDYDIYMVNEETQLEDDGEDWRMEM